MLRGADLHLTLPAVCLNRVAERSRQLFIALVTQSRPYGQTRSSRGVTAAGAAVGFSEVGLLGEDQGIVYLDPKVPDRALQLRVTEQELAGP